MQGDKVHRLDEFAQLPWNQLNPERCTHDWSYGRGGYGFSDSTATLSVVHPDGSADIWELPPALAAMLTMARRMGANEVRRDIHNILEIERS